MKQELHEIDQCIKDIHDEYMKEYQGKKEELREAKLFLVAMIYSLYDKMNEEYERGYRAGRSY